MKATVLWLFLITTNTVVAQTYFEVSGKVIDLHTRAALPYANITIKNSSLGTVSNELGEFDFFIPIDLKNDTLLISYIGYETFRDKVSSLNEIKEFYLTESPIVLSDVTVSSDGARKLVEDAMNAIPLLYPTVPYLMEGFHRSWEIVDFTDSITYPGTLIEAAVTVYDPGYVSKRSGNTNKEEIYVNEIRRSAIMEGWNYGSGNALTSLLDKNLVKYNRETAFIFLQSFLKFPNDLIYEWVGFSKINDENVSVISIEIPNAQRFPAFYKVYVSEEDHAILQFELFGEKKEIEYTLGPWHIEQLNFKYIFKRYEKKIYLSYIKQQYTIKNLDQAKKRIIRTENYSREFLVNKITTLDVEDRRKSLAPLKAARGASLATQTKVYNEAFWKNYNLILENPLDKKLIKVFEQKRIIPRSN